MRLDVSFLVWEIKWRTRNYDSRYKETLQKILITATTVGPELLKAQFFRKERNKGKSNVHERSVSVLKKKKGNNNKIKTMWNSYYVTAKT